MNRIAILGSDGSMGKRYQAILRHINIDAALFEATNWGQIVTTVGIDGIIIASPTDCHLENLREIARLNIPILCEKPIVQDQRDLNEILEMDLNITMVNQYAFIDGIDGEGVSYYDYYNTGKDGLEWDCINIIGLAKGDVFINDKSPIWNCQINGKKLTLEDVYAGYIKMIHSWQQEPKSNYDYISQAHRKIWEKKYVKGRHRDTSEIKQQSVAEQVPHGHKRAVDAGLGDKSRSEVSKLYKQR